MTQTSGTDNADLIHISMQNGEKGVKSRKASCNTKGNRTFNS